VLNEYLDTDLAASVQAIGAVSVLDGSALADMPPARAQLLLRRWLERLGERAPDQARSLQIWLRCIAADSSYAQIDHEGLSLLRYRRQVFAVPQGRDMLARLAQACLTQYRLAPLGLDVSLPLRGEQALPLPSPFPLLHIRRVHEGPGLATEWLGGQTLTLTSPWPMSARFRLRGARHARTLKDLLQDAGVPEWLRPMALALSVGDELLAVAGVGASATLPWASSGERWAIDLDWSAPAEGQDTPERQLAGHILGNKLV
jgi:tRNA(Ile)-lysidine synthase